MYAASAVYILATFDVCRASKQLNTYLPGVYVALESHINLIIVLM